MRLNPSVAQFHFGLEKPIKILHLTDLHLSLSNENDSDALKEKTAKRREVFFKEANAPQRDPVGFLEEALEYSKQFDYTVITGDIFDRISDANIEAARKILGDKDYLFCPGNHEFSTVDGHCKPEEKEEIRNLLKTIFPGNLTLDSKIIGGVNLVAADNSHYYWTEEQLELLKKEVEKGYPILLFTHSPLENGVRTLNPELDRRTAIIRQEILNSAGESAIKPTCQATDYIANEPLIKATFGGHFHGNFLKEFGNKNTYILGGLFKGIVGEIHID